MDYDDDSFDEPRAPQLLATPQQPHHHTFGGIRQVEQTSAVSAREHINNSHLNPYATLHGINRELMELGLPSPLLLPELPECLEDNQRVVECLVQLLQQRRHDIKFHEDMEEALRKAMGEEDQLRTTIQRLERELDGAQREAATNKLRWQDTQRQLAESEAQRKKILAELRTTRSNAQMVKAQTVHDGKKREQEMNKLKERLQKLITDKHRSAKVEVELMNPVRAGRNARKDAAGRDRQMLEELVARYESNEQKLVAKVDRLEEMVRKLREAVRELYAAISGNLSYDGMATADADDEETTDDSVAATIGTMDAIHDHVAQEREQRATSGVDTERVNKCEEQIKQLVEKAEQKQEEVDELQQILAEQKQAMDRLLEEKESSANHMDVSFSEMSLEQLDSEREALRLERQQLEDERKRFTEAAVELGHERSELKKEREAFESSARQAPAASKPTKSTEDLVSMLPPTPQWMRAVDTNQATPAIYQQMQQSLLEHGTPTQDFLAGIAAMTAASNNSRILEPETPSVVRVASRNNTNGSRTPHYALPTHHRGSGSAINRTPSRNNSGQTPVRTPVEVRTSRQPRICTRTGCAAHVPHTHEDGPAAAELKPPMPGLFRGKNSSTLRGAKASANDIFR